MIEILCSKFAKPLAVDLWRQYECMLPVELRKKNASYLKWQDRHAHLIGKLLLLKGLKEKGYGKGILEEIEYGSHGRPFLREADVDFNISHSGQFVICAIGTGMRIGVDIEEIKPIDFSYFKQVMNANQWKTINWSDDPAKMFYTYWTIKESMIKADSRGLSISLSSILVKDEKVSYDDCTWHTRALDIDANYCAHITTDQPAYDCLVRKVDFFQPKEVYF